jgi:hypothetical protein
MFAYELGPLRLTPMPMTYGTPILAMRELYLARALSCDVRSFEFFWTAGAAERGWFTAGSGATETVGVVDDTMPVAQPVRTATC